MAGTIQHQWNGTILTITSDSGTSSCDLKGAKGDDGARGAQGAPGSSVAEDSQKLGGVAAAQYALKNNVPAHNLLDNSDFTNPVNQRGATTATLGKYFIDRWNTEAFPSGPSITIDGNGLTLLPTTSSTAGIYQKLPDYEKRKGKVHTFAICVDNVWKCVSFPMGNFGVGYLIHGLYLFSVDNQNILLRNNTSDNPAPITIQHVALYEGAYDASTLPAYQPKGYAAELAECQRYYQQYNGSEMSAVGSIESGNIYIRCPLRAPMRVAPSLVQSSVDIWTTYNETTNKTKAYTFYSSTPQLVNLKCVSSVESNYLVVLASNITAMAFSADL